MAGMLTGFSGLRRYPERSRHVDTAVCSVTPSTRHEEAFKKKNPGRLTRVSVTGDFRVHVRCSDRRRPVEWHYIETTSASLSD